MPGPEGLVLGAGHSLPDADIVRDFDFKSPRLSLSIWEIPEHPEAVLRLQRDIPGDEEACWQLARQGIQHLRELQDAGLTMPAQRFVVYNGTERFRLSVGVEAVGARDLAGQLRAMR